jgi:CheY-like chemotaxis protein
MPTDPAPTILVVEHDASIQDLLHEVLRDAGYQVLQTNDLVQALDLAAAARPAVILLDPGLPMSPSAAVLGRLKLDPATRHIPVVAMSGLPLPDGDGWQRLDGWIEKPFDLDVLVEHVGRLAAGPGAGAANPAMLAGMR